MASLDRMGLTVAEAARLADRDRYYSGRLCSGFLDEGAVAKGRPSRERRSFVWLNEHRAWPVTDDDLFCNERVQVTPPVHV